LDVLELLRFRAYQRGMSDARIRVVLSLEEEKFMRGKTRLMIVSAIAPLALVAAACGGGGGDTSSGQQSGGAAGGGEISLRSCTPQNPLIPANTNEVCGGNVLDAVEAKLVHYNADTAAPELDIAQSIDTLALAEDDRELLCEDGFGSFVASSVSVAEMFALACRLLDVEARPVQEPTRVRPDASEVMVLCSDPSRAREVLGWQAKTRVEDLIPMMVDADLRRVGRE